VADSGDRPGCETGPRRCMLEEWVRNRSSGAAVKSRSGSALAVSTYGWTRYRTGTWEPCPPPAFLKERRHRPSGRRLCRGLPH
jgi:hypothetical protein